MRAKDFPKLDKPKKAPSEKERQKALDDVHAQALEMNAAFDAQADAPRKDHLPGAAARACQKKRPYPTAGAAAQACAESQSKITDGYAPLRVYQCDQCDLWHLTSKPLRTGRKPL